MIDTYEKFYNATGLPELAYLEWLGLPDDLSRSDVIDMYSDPDKNELHQTLMLRDNPELLDG